MISSFKCRVICGKFNTVERIFISRVKISEVQRAVHTGTRFLGVCCSLIVLQHALPTTLHVYSDYPPSQYLQQCCCILYL